MVEYDYIEALGGGSFLNMPCTMNQNMEVEFKFMTTDYPDSTYQRQGNFFVLGGNGGDVVLRGEDQHQYWYSGGGDWVVSDWWTLNDEHTATWTKDVWTFDEHSHNTTGGCYTGSQNLSITCIDCGLRIVSVTVRLNGSVVNEFVGAEDNGVVGLYDKANDLFYQPTSGTWSTGSYYVFEPSQNTFSFGFNGGTQTFTVEATNAWTCAVPTDFTISPMSGNSGTTTVTITAPRRISAVSDTVTFTDSDQNTFDISISQSVGTITPNLTLYQGATTIKKMYYGDSLVYRKMAHSPSLVISGDSFTFPPTSYTAATVVVTTDANWSYSTEASWLQLTKTGNNLEIVPTSDWDQGSAPRTATVTVTADNGFISKSVEIDVTQANTLFNGFYVENVSNSTGTLTLMEGANLNHNLEYSTDGSTWTAANSGAPFTLSIPSGGKLYLRGTNSNWRQASDGHNSFDMDVDWKIGGNMLSIIDKDNYETLATVPNYAFQNTFSVSQTLVDASDANTGAATQLGQYAFHNVLNRSPRVVGCPDTSGITRGEYWCLIGACAYCYALTTPFDLRNMTSINTTQTTTQALYEGCSSLTYAYTPNVLDWTAGNYWLKDVAPNGTLYAPTGFTGNAGKPSDWTMAYYN